MINPKYEKSDKIELPSGAVVDLFYLNVDACKTPDDAFELLQTLQEKIIEIEYHLELFDGGCHPDGSPFSPVDPPSRQWQARAKKALACSKLQKTDAQYKFQKLSQAEKETRRSSFERAFVECAHRMLDPQTLNRIRASAGAEELDVVAA